MSADSGQPLATRTLRGVFWAYGSYAGGRVLVLVATAILARLLTPADFGLVALALVFTAFLETLSDLGMTQALVIVDEDDVEEKAQTVFVVSLGVGLALMLAVGALGPAASAFFDQSELVAMMPALGANLFLKSLGTTHYVLAQKRLQFQKRTAAELADVIVRGLTGIGLAIAGFGAWSLVIGYLAGTVAMNLTLWIVVRWRPTFRPRREHLRGVLRFGGALTGVRIISAALGVGDDLIVGRVLGTTALGLYTIAYRLPELLIFQTSLVAGEVLFPAMATLDRKGLARAFLTSLRYALMVGLPLAVGLGVLAEPVILAVFGDKWEDAIPAMRVMALWALVSPIAVIIGTAYKATDRVDLLLKLAIPQALVLIPALIVLADRGIVVVAACQAVVAIVAAIVGMIVATRMLHVTALDLWRAGWPPAAAALGLAATLLGVEWLELSPWPALALAVVVGSAVYLGLLWLFARDTLRHFFATALAQGGPGPDAPPLDELPAVEQRLGAAPGPTGQP
jgi:lipopolysaccharide exporter